MADPAKFWNRIAAKYAAQPISDEAAYARKLAETQARLRPDWQILELGCGTGNTAFAHAPHVAHVEAVDFSEAMLAHGRARAGAEGIDNVTFTCASLDDFAPGRSYDAVLMLSLLHLIPDWRGAIARAWALTRPGGVFVSSTSFLADSGLMLRLALKLLGPLGRVPQVAMFSPDELKAAILAQGFEIETAWRPAPDAAEFIIARRPEAVVAPP